MSPPLVAPVVALVVAALIGVLAFWLVRRERETYTYTAGPNGEPPGWESLADNDPFKWCPIFYSGYNYTLDSQQHGENRGGYDTLCWGIPEYPRSFDYYRSVFIPPKRGITAKLYTQKDYKGRAYTVTKSTPKLPDKKWMSLKIIRTVPWP